MRRDRYHRYPGSARVHFDAADVDAGRLQIAPRLFAELICTDFSNQLHGVVQSAYGHSLVSPFPSWMDLKAATKDRFARSRKPSRTRDQIGIDTTHHHNRFMTGWHSPGLFVQKNHAIIRKAAPMQPPRAHKGIRRTSRQARFWHGTAVENSCQMKTPHAAEIIVAPCPME